MAAVWRWPGLPGLRLALAFLAVALAAVGLLAGLTAALAAGDVSALGSQQHADLTGAVTVAAGAAAGHRPICPRSWTWPRARAPMYRSATVPATPSPARLLRHRRLAVRRPCRGPGPAGRHRSGPTAFAAAPHVRRQQLAEQIAPGGRGRHPAIPRSSGRYLAALLPCSAAFPRLRKRIGVPHYRDPDGSRLVTVRIGCRAVRNTGRLLIMRSGLTGQELVVDHLLPPRPGAAAGSGNAAGHGTCGSVSRRHGRPHGRGGAGRLRPASARGARSPVHRTAPPAPRRYA